MEIDKVTKYRNLLLSALHNHKEYDEAAGLKRETLLVEGITDKRFIERIQVESLICWNVSYFMQRDDGFRTSRTRMVSQYNSRDVIIAITRSIAYGPGFYGFPEHAQKWPLFGLVDNDFDDSEDYSRVEKLFFTDTHDLETLMISTDKDLFARIESCDISAEEIKEALYLANQLAEFRQAINRVSKKQKDRTESGMILKSDAIKETDGTIDYESFTNGDRIILADLVEHINNKMEKPLPKGKKKKTCEEIAKDMRNLLNKEGVWKTPIESFTEDTYLWKTINGHDILSAICYINPRVKERFVNSGDYGLNREFELALSELYDYQCLKNTKLYNRLKAAGLIKE